MADNVFPTEDDERNAHTATYANQARAALFRLAQDLPDDDPWAEKVDDILWEAQHKLEALADEEMRSRPGMLGIGRARLAEFLAKDADARAEWEAISARAEA